MEWLKNWFERISAELQALKSEELVDPTDTEVTTNDHKVGEASDDLKRLWSLGQKKRTEGKALLDEFKKIEKPSPDQENEFTAKSSKLRSDYELLRGLFWASAKDTFGLWDKSSVGIRKGWEIVWSEPDGESDGFPGISILSISGGGPRGMSLLDLLQHLG